MDPALEAAPSRLPPRPFVLLLACSGVVAAVAVAVGLLQITGQLTALTDGLFDPGRLVRFGLPTARVIHDLAAAMTVGLLILSVWCVPPSTGTPGYLAGVRQLMVQYARIAAVMWLAAGLAVVVLTAASVSGFKVTAPGFGRIVIFFVLQLDLGRAYAVSVLLVGVVVLLTRLATRLTTVAWAAALALAALLPLALVGHAAGSSSHMASVDSLAFHLLGVVVWVGGLGGLVLVAAHLGENLAPVTRRYSTVAGWCFVLVGVSGLLNAALRVGSWSALASPYGLLVLAKAGALVVLGLAGLVHRRITIDRLGSRPRLFLRLAAAELLVMAGTMGLGVALSRSAPPAQVAEPDAVTALLGYPAPPPLTIERYLFSFYPQVLWLFLAVVAVGLYLVGVRRLRLRGDRWPLQRLLFWLSGCVALVFFTSGGPAVYGRQHFSTHMIQHMSLMVIVPFLLVFGAPVTLALRALPARHDGSFGPRETLLALVHSRVLRLLGHPAVAATLFAGSMVVFYYSPLFSVAMFTHTGHVLMTAHFLLVGYLFIWALVGIDPGPIRLPYPLRLMVLLMTMAFHAIFGVSLMSSNGLLARDWWQALGLSDDTALLADQQAAGSIAWAAGDIPSLLLALALIVGWVRSDTREARRLDRKADRDSDADLQRYNERLADISRRDQDLRRD